MNNKQLKPLEIILLILFLLAISFAKANAESAVVMISDGYLNIRAYPTENSVSVGKLYDDDEITINRTVVTKWVEVLVSNEIVGYCDVHYLRILQENIETNISSCQQRKSFRVIKDSYYYYRTDTSTSIGALRVGLIFTGNYVKDKWVECRTSDELRKIYVLAENLEEI